MDTRTVAFPESQASTHSPMEESLLPHSPGPQSKISRVKVCPECGKVFHKTQKFKLHVSSHQPLLECDMCSFKTKESKRFRMHKLTHKTDNPDNECYICHKYFSTDVTLRIHQKKIHRVYVCKYCDNKYSTEEELRNHMREQYGYTRKVKGYVEPSDPKQIKLQTAAKIPDIDKGQFMCQFCKKLCIDKYHLKLHLAQHLGISSKQISDELLDKHVGLQKQRIQFQVSKENNVSRVEFEAPVSSDDTACNAAVKCETVLEESADEVDTEIIPPVTSTSFKPSLPSHDQALLIANTVGQPLSVMRSNTKHRSPTTNTINELMRPEVIPTVCNTSFEQLSTVSSISSGQALLICNPAGEALPVLRPQILLQSPALSTTDELTVSPSTSAVYVPSDQLTASQYNRTPVVMSAPEVTPSTSFSNKSQTAATKVLIPKQGKQSEKDKEYFPSCCVYCATVFPTLGDLKKHSLEAHPILTVRKDLLPRMTKKEMYEEFKGSVLKKRKAKLQLPCDTCGEVCNSSKALRNHKKKHRRSFNCEECNIVHRNPHKLLRHQKKYHKDKYRCRFACGILCDSYSDLNNHYKRVHDKDYSRIECPHCQKGFIYKASLMNHLEKCMDCPPDQRPAHVCGNCEGFFPNVEAYNNHAKNCLPSLKKKDQSKDNVDGNVARKTAESTSKNLAESTTEILESENTSDDDSDTTDSSECSVEEHSVNLPYEFRHKRSMTGNAKCKYCPDVLVERDKGVSHILLWHQDLVTCMTASPQKCEFCGKLCKTLNSLCKHLLEHYSKLNMWDALVPMDILKLLTVKNYCWICKSTYTGIRNMDHGIKRDIYIDEAFEAEECDRAVVEPLKCEKCNKNFSTRKEFWMHVKNHISTLPTTFFTNKPTKFRNNPRLHKCTECQYECGKMKEFHKHLASHFLEEIKEQS